MVDDDSKNVQPRHSSSWILVSFPSSGPKGSGKGKGFPGGKGDGNVSMLDFSIRHFAQSVTEQQIRVVKVRGTVGMRTMVGHLVGCALTRPQSSPTCKSWTRRR